MEAVILLNCIFSFVLINAQLNRQIAINQLEVETTTVYEEVEVRTMKTYRMNPTPKLTRKTTSIPHIIDKTCLLKPDQGPCRGKIVMWYFNPKYMNCSTFHWGGCQGNGNRYDKYSECESTCLSGPGWKESRPRYCSLRFDYGWCFGADERYFYDPQWGVCKRTIYSGCGGNKNNFHSKEKCDAICRFGKFNLNPRKGPKEPYVKKVLIVNPDEMTAPTMRGGRPVTTSTKGLTGSWWVNDFKKRVSYQISLDVNKENNSSGLGAWQIG